MILVIGGYSQGKLDYVKKRFSKDKVAIVVNVLEQIILKIIETEVWR